MSHYVFRHAIRDLAIAAAVSVAAQQHGLVACDERGSPVRPAKLWNDTESAPDASWLIKQLGGAEAVAAPEPPAEEAPEPAAEVETETTTEETQEETE